MGRMLDGEELGVGRNSFPPFFLFLELSLLAELLLDGELFAQSLDEFLVGPRAGHGVVEALLHLRQLVAQVVDLRHVTTQDST